MEFGSAEQKRSVFVREGDMPASVKKRLSAAAVLAVACLVAGMPARAADDAAAFFQGKQIRFFTMGSPGGGYDAYTRTLGTYLVKKLGF
jgi:tripartite-type tricarboxylate transporter receptor subunit TctC